MQEPATETVSGEEEPQRPDYVAACAFAKVWTRLALIFLLALAVISVSPFHSFGLYLAILLVVVFLTDMAWDLLACHIMRRQGHTPVNPAHLLGQSLAFWGVVVVAAVLGSAITRDDWTRLLAVIVFQLAMFWGLDRLRAG